MIRICLAAALLFAVSPAIAAPQSTSRIPQQNSSPSRVGRGGEERAGVGSALERRVDALFRKLTEHEKLAMLSGTGFTTQPVPRLGIPALAMVDGPRGVRGGPDNMYGPSTQFLEPIAMAATWNPSLIAGVGKSMGEEVQNKGGGAKVLLGPCVNIERSPLGGRDGESFGEDPWLAGRIAVGYIDGVQSTGAAACIKHFACNNEEVDRDFVNVLVDERTLREIYLPAFQAGIVDGHAWTLMASYNQVNGYHAAANEYLLTDVLRHDWGFDGIAMSDWGAVHETDGTINAGLDLEMPGGSFLTADKLAAALQKGHISQAEIDLSVKRILRTIIRTGLMDNPQKPNHALVDSPAHRKANFQAASEAMVLLKNAAQALPLSRREIRSLAVVGPMANAVNHGIGGSSYVEPTYFVTPLDGIKKLVGSTVDVRYALGCTLTGGAVRFPNVVPTDVLTPESGIGHGLSASYYANGDLKGKPFLTRTDAAIDFDWSNNPPAPGASREHYSVRWTGTLTPPATGKYVFGLNSDDGARLFVDDQPVIDHWEDGDGVDSYTGSVDLVAGKPCKVRLEYYQDEGDASVRLSWLKPGESSPGIQQAVAAAAHADAAVVFVGSSGEGEGSDRSSMDLPGSEADLIKAVAAVNRRTIVVVSSGGPCAMADWIGDVPAVLQSWNAGQETGNAVAGILFGDIDPSGKLPMTIGMRREDYADYGNFPGVNGRVRYAEGIFVGYRHFDHAGIKPLFPFGYGLSYTTFRYHDLRFSSTTLRPSGTITASLLVTNTGAYEGKEVVELYTHDPAPKIAKAVRELKGFVKVDLNPGQTKTVSFTLTPAAVAYCDVRRKAWRADAGDYDALIGSSSRDIRLTGTFLLTADYVKPVPDMGDWSATLDEGYASHRSATASSTQDNLVPSNAVDGDPSTRWGSQFSDPQWLAVDLGRTRHVSRVKIWWEDAYAKSYQIQVSMDGKTWSTVYATTNGRGYKEQKHFAPVGARWVRVYCTERGTDWGDSIYSFGVFGK